MIISISMWILEFCMDPQNENKWYNMIQYVFFSTKLYTFFIATLVLFLFICPSPYFYYISVFIFWINLLQCLQLYAFWHMVLQNWRLHNLHLGYAEIWKHSFLYGCHQSLKFYDSFFFNYSHLMSYFGNYSFSFLGMRLYLLQLKHLKIYFLVYVS